MPGKPAALVFRKVRRSPVKPLPASYPSKRKSELDHFLSGTDNGWNKWYQYTEFKAMVKSIFKLLIALWDAQYTPNHDARLAVVASSRQKACAHIAPAKLRQFLTLEHVRPMCTGR